MIRIILLAAFFIIIFMAITVAIIMPAYRKIRFWQKDTKKELDKIEKQLK